MKKIRASIRGILLVFYTVSHMLPGMVKSIFTENYLPLALRCRRWWAKRSTWMLGIRIQRSGEVPAPADGPYLFIGNHRSYIDPVALLTDVEALPVAKAEVSGWPLIGYAAKVTGILYVERESKRSRADTLGAMQQYLDKGFSVLVYPEGTTSTDAKTLPFKRGAFRLAAKYGTPVLPVAIEYLDLGDAWVGDDTFIPHFLRCFGKKRTRLFLRYGPPMTDDAPDALLRRCQDWIDEQIIELRREHDIS